MGDFVSYNTYQPTAEDEQQATPTTIANEGGTHRITINGEDARYTSSGVQTFNASEGFSAYAEDDWRSTARTSFGSPTNDITSDSIVTIGGITSTVEVFARTGILQKQGDGYTLSGAQQQARQQEQQADDIGADEDTNGDTAVMPADVVDTIDRAVEGMSQATIQNGMALGIAASLGEISIEDVAAGVARNTGMDPADAAQRTEFVVTAYQAQADHFITDRLGVAEGDLQDFYEFAKQPHNKGALRTAINGQLYGNDMAGWRPLVDRYFANTAPSSAVLKSRGFETKTGGNGEELVRIRGAWMTTKAAAKAGLI